MLKNYFTTAIRNLWRNKTFTFINLLGLSIGISSALVIFLVVYYEYSFDRFEPDRDRVYRVVIDAKFNGIEGHSVGVQAPLAGAVAREMSGVELAVPVMSFQGNANAKVAVARGDANDAVYKEQPGIVFTNQAFFQLIPRHWLAGSKTVALDKPFSVVLSQSRAAKYFPNTPAEDVIGRKLTYNDRVSATVTGVVADLTRPSLFSATEFLSYSTISKTNLQHEFMMDVWNDWMAYSKLYLKLSPGKSAAGAEAQINGLLKKYNSGDVPGMMHELRLHLQPLDDVHFNHLYPAFGDRVADRKVLYGLLAIAGFLLFLGCINFINLTTAQSARRAKEIGIRKTLGSSRPQLMFQFLGESFVITLLATIISTAFVPVLLNIFKDFIPEGLSTATVQQPFLFLFLLGLSITVSFLAGFYPSVVLTAFQPVLVLKNQSYTEPGKTRTATVRKVLTVSQFVIAQFFVIATIMVGRQINFSINSDLGFNKTGVLTFTMPQDSVKTHRALLLQSIRNIRGVSDVSTGFMAPADKGVAFTNISYYNDKGVQVPTSDVQIRWGDPEFIKVYGIPLVAGRNLLPSDTIREFLINQTYARQLGFKTPAAAVGQMLVWNNKRAPIVGVMRDFHDQSMRAQISNIALGGANGSTFHVRLQPNTGGTHLWQQAISAMQADFKSMYPDQEFEYSFVDDTVAHLYDTERQVASLLQWATAFAIIISCLGLLGLVMYTIGTRVKEIGIRKILGASVFNIVTMLSKSFLQLVLLAFVIAAPFAWWVIYKWLESYAYKTQMNWWIFALSGSIMLLIAILTLSIQIVRTARANPARSLRSE